MTATIALEATRPRIFPPGWERPGTVRLDEMPTKPGTAKAMTEAAAAGLARAVGGDDPEYRQTSDAAWRLWALLRDLGGLVWGTGRGKGGVLVRYENLAAELHVHYGTIVRAVALLVDWGVARVEPTYAITGDPTQPVRRDRNVIHLTIPAEGRPGHAEAMLARANIAGHGAKIREANQRAALDRQAASTAQAASTSEAELVGASCLRCGQEDAQAGTERCGGCAELAVAYVLAATPPPVEPAEPAGDAAYSVRSAWGRARDAWLDDRTKRGEAAERIAVAEARAHAPP